MKKSFVFGILLVFFFMGCEIDSIERPDDLISPKKMEAILKDVILMKAVRSNFGGNIKYDSLFGVEFIYAKHNITAAQLDASEQYYVKRPKEYVIMHKRVLLQLQQMSDSIDAVILEEKNAAVKDLK